MIEITCDRKRSTARGRNGWFSLARIEVKEVAMQVWIDAYSRRAGKDAPVMIEITLDEAEKLAHALLEAVNGKA